MIEVTIKIKLEMSRNSEVKRDFDSLKIGKVLRTFEGKLADEIISSDASKRKTLNDVFKNLKHCVTSACEVLPKQAKCSSFSKVSDKVNEIMQEKISKKQSLKALGALSSWPRIRKTFDERIKTQKDLDYEDKVKAETKTLEKCSEKGDSKGVWKSINKLGGRVSSFNNIQPCKIKNDKGNTQEIENTKQLLDAWKKFAEEKFKATENEEKRGLRSEIPYHDPDVPDDFELSECLKKMKLGKATGEDGIPTEIYIHSPLARESLFELTKMIFKEEEVPDDFVNGIFSIFLSNI